MESLEALLFVSEVTVGSRLPRAQSKAHCTTTGQQLVPLLLAAHMFRVMLKGNALETFRILPPDIAVSRELRFQSI